MVSRRQMVSKLIIFYCLFVWFVYLFIFRDNKTISKDLPFPVPVLNMRKGMAMAMDLNNLLTFSPSLEGESKILKSTRL